MAATDFMVHLAFINKRAEKADRDLMLGKARALLVRNVINYGCVAVSAIKQERRQNPYSEDEWEYLLLVYVEKIGESSDISE